MSQKFATCLLYFRSPLLPGFLSCRRCDSSRRRNPSVGVGSGGAGGRGFWSEVGTERQEPLAREEATSAVEENECGRRRFDLSRRHSPSVRGGSGGSGAASGARRENGGRRGNREADNERKTKRSPLWLKRPAPRGRHNFCPTENFPPPKISPPWKNSGPVGGGKFCMDTVAVI